MALRRRLLAVIIVVALAVLVAASFSATAFSARAEETSGDVKVIIKTTSGTPISGITVRLYSGDAPRYEGVSDVDGRATISAERQNLDMSYSVYLTLNGSDVKTELNLRPGDEEASLTLYTVTYRDGDKESSIYTVHGGVVALRSTTVLDDMNYPVGKLFVGWKKNGSGAILSGGTKEVVKSDTTYVAQWQDKKYEYVIAQSASGYSLAEDGVIAPTSYFDNLSDLMLTLETLRDATKPCKITLNISEITYPLTLKYGTYNLYTYASSTVTSAFPDGAIKVGSGATLNLYGKLAQSSTALEGDYYSIAVEGGKLLLNASAETDSILIIGSNDSAEPTEIFAENYTFSTEIGYRYDSDSSYEYVTGSTDDYAAIKEKILGYTLVTGVNNRDNFTLRGEDSSECFGMAYDEEDKRLYMEEKFSVSFLSNFVETESTRLVGILPSTVYVLKGSGASLPALPGATFLRGHSFGGWLDSEVLLSVGTTFYPASDTVLYASFTPLTYTITYTDIKHASATVTTHTYMTDTRLSPLTTPGYTFIAYTSDTVELYKDGDDFVLDGEAIASDITLGATWSLDAPTVTLDDYVSTYDGKTHFLTPSVTHSSPDPVTYLYNWSDGGNLENYAVRRVSDSTTVTLVLTAWDGELFSRDVTLTVTVSIAPRPVKIKIKDVSQIVGRYPVTPDYEIVEGTLATGDSLSTLGITWTREEGDSVGDYNMTATASSPDYTVEFISGTYSVIPVATTPLIIVAVVASVAALSLLAFIVAAILKRKRGK